LKTLIKLNADIHTLESVSLKKKYGKEHQMNQKNNIYSLVALVIMVKLILITGCHKISTDSSAKTHNRIRLEHVALNVPDPVKMGDWYRRNLNMKIFRPGPPPENPRFICDEQGNMMLEIFHHSTAKLPDYHKLDPFTLHIAFMTDDVKALRAKLIAAGATPLKKVNVTSSGDEITMLRDPWGITIQLVKRAQPMLPHRQAK